MKARILAAAAAMTMAGLGVSAQQTFSIDTPATPKKIYEGHLDMGAVSPDGEAIEVNSYYISVGGKPQIPVMGEFHYSRYPRERWEEEILKMKAGGITVIPTYIFWNLHEQTEGKFDWSGNLDLRTFVRLCQKHGMKVIARIGPFSHGEMRSGGFPDWIYSKPLEVRCDDPLYLQYVDRFYAAIGHQLRGLYHQDGGPIIGVQIENEMQHSSAGWYLTYPGQSNERTTALMDAATTMEGVGIQTARLTAAQQGEEHMRTLKKLAESHGIKAAFYTATGWGMAAVIDNEAIPVTAAYTFPTWGSNAPSQFCLFKDIQRVPDYFPVRYDGEKFPSFAAEMGVGIQMTYNRRPVVEAEAAEALMIRTLGSGSNGIGYYMYHGGSTPAKATGTDFMSEDGCPKISYDFQAPLGEFGLENDSYRTLRVIHSFVNDFGDRLAPMETVLPEGNEEIKATDRDRLRWAIRTKDGAGFIFIVNYQDHDTLRHDMTGFNLRVNTPDGAVTIPAKGTLSIPKDRSFILPFNMDLDGALLRYATAQPVMRIETASGTDYFFMQVGDMAPEYSFDSSTIRGHSSVTAGCGLDSTFTVRTRAGKTIRITTLTREEALNSAKIDGKLVITKATVIPRGDSLELLSLGENEVEYVTYPSKAGLKWQKASVDKADLGFSVRNVSSRRMAVHFDTMDVPAGVREFFLRIDYTADTAWGFIGSELAMDHFYHGIPWTIGLDRFRDRLENNDLVLHLRPVGPRAPFLSDLPSWAKPDFSKEMSIRKINSMEIIPQYTFTVSL